MCTAVSLVASGGCIKVDIFLEVMDMSCRIRGKIHNECGTTFLGHKTPSSTSIKDYSECGTTFLERKAPSTKQIEVCSECGTTFYD